MELIIDLIAEDLSQYYTVTEITCTNEDTARLFNAIENNHNIEEMKYLLNDHQTSINAPLIVNRLYQGWTALHFACCYKNEALVHLLITDYKADVHARTEDGMEPIQLAVILEHTNIVRHLLNNDANINAEITKDILISFRPKEQWIDDFGDTMTLLTFAVLYSDGALARVLIANGADLKVRSTTNKTLLMYALENEHTNIAELLIRYLDSDSLNLHDDEGFSAIHYLLHPKDFWHYRYVASQLKETVQIQKQIALTALISGGADIHAIVVGDPSTLILNAAAYRSSCKLLEVLLPSYESLKNSRALYYATLHCNIKDSFRSNSVFNYRRDLVLLEEERLESIKLILKDLTSRRIFGLFIPEEERKLMEKLIAKDVNLKNFVQDFEEKFINGKLKSLVVNYGGERIDFYEVFSRLCNSRKMRSVVNNRTLVDAIKSSCLRADKEYLYFLILFDARIVAVRKKVKLLDELRTIQQLRKAVPLPYELILETAEYLDNEELEIFIMSFYEM